MDSRVVFPSATSISKEIFIGKFHLCKSHRNVASPVKSSTKMWIQQDFNKSVEKNKTTNLYQL